MSTPTIVNTDVKTCGTCRAPIVWARMVNSGKANPLDSVPVPHGNVVLLRRDGQVLIGEARPPNEPPSDVPRYVSHFATCPQRKQHRRPK
jgi:hypothetical protein